MASERQRRIAQVIGEYAAQGFHRTGTAVDRASADWLADLVRGTGLAPTLEAFPLQRVDPVASQVIANDRRIDGLPLFDGGFTGEQGVRGRLGPLASDAEIGLADLVPNAAGSGALADARRAQRHAAIVCVTRGGRPGLCASNADAFLQPFGPPVLQVGSEHAGWIEDVARQRLEVQVVAHVRRTAAEAFNVTTRLPGADPTLLPFVIMTPRSGWFWCASERGGGLACWVELMRVLRDLKPARDVLFVASSGHELGHLGINAFVDRRPGIVKQSVGWIHLGANIGAAIEPDRPVAAAGPPGAPSAGFDRGPGNTIQASDGEFEALLASALAAKGLAIGTRAPRGRVPGGEAEVVHRGGGRYVSVIGRNAMFHNPEDRGPDVFDAKLIDAFVDAFAAVARPLVGQEPARAR